MRQLQIYVYSNTVHYIQNVQYKTDLNDDWNILPITSKNQVTTNKKFQDQQQLPLQVILSNMQIKKKIYVPNLYTAQIPITEAKYNDLQNLKQVIRKRSTLIL